MEKVNVNEFNMKNEIKQEVIDDPLDSNSQNDNTFAQVDERNGMEKLNENEFNIKSEIKQEVIDEPLDTNSQNDNTFAQVDIFHVDIKVETSEQNAIDPLDIGPKTKGYQKCDKNVKKHICETCGVAFGRPNLLNIHITSVHKGLKNYKCETCGKALSEAGSLKRHINIVHKGFKNHKQLLVIYMTQ